MKYQELSDRYETLETDIINKLKHEIKISKYESKHINENAIKVDKFKYVELTLIDGKLVFFDEFGYHYNLFNRCSVEDFIDILNKL